VQAATVDVAVATKEEADAAMDGYVCVCLNLDRAHFRPFCVALTNHSKLFMSISIERFAPVLLFNSVTIFYAFWSDV